MASSTPPHAASGSCPICSRPVDLNYRPFCSRRCADVDLSRWLRGTYAIPSEESAEPNDQVASVPANPTNGPDDKI